MGAVTSKNKAEKIKNEKEVEKFQVLTRDMVMRVLGDVFPATYLAKRYGHQEKKRKLATKSDKCMGKKCLMRRIIPALSEGQLRQDRVEAGKKQPAQENPMRRSIADHQSQRRNHYILRKLLMVGQKAEVKGSACKLTPCDNLPW